MWFSARLGLLGAMATARSWPSPCLALTWEARESCARLPFVGGPAGGRSPAMGLMPLPRGTSERMFLAVSLGLRRGSGAGERAGSQQALVHRDAGCRVAA